MPTLLQDRIANTRSKLMIGLWGRRDMIRATFLSAFFFLLVATTVAWPDESARASCSYSDFTDGGAAQLIGTLWLRRDADYQRQLVACVESLWLRHADPAAKVVNASFSYDASSALLAALQFDPKGFLQEIDKRPRLLHLWLKALRRNSFVWYGDPPCDYETQRQTLLGYLRDPGRQLEEYRSFIPILNALEETECRTVQ